MTDPQNDVGSIAVIVPVLGLLTEAMQALLDGDFKRASNATDLAEKLLRGTMAPQQPRSLEVA
jgi:hypothetical protein